MTNFLLKAIPPQAAKIYLLLKNRKPMSAKQIGKKLRIFPNAVYRAIRSLLELGFVGKVREYPLKYQAKSNQEAIEFFCSLTKQNFHEAFGIKESQIAQRYPLQLVFIRTRTEMLKLIDKDVKNAKTSFDLIVSGHEVPADTILSQKRAIDRGVKIRILIQRFDPATEKLYRNMKKMGFGVKYGPDMGARIFIIDRRVIYFTSYDSKNKEEALGMRFAYAPYARLMDELFEQRWKLGKEITN